MAHFVLEQAKGPIVNARSESLHSLMDTIRATVSQEMTPLSCNQLIVSHAQYGPHAIILCASAIGSFAPDKVRNRFFDARTMPILFARTKKEAVSNSKIVWDFFYAMASGESKVVEKELSRLSVKDDESELCYMLISLAGYHGDFLILSAVAKHFPNTSYGMMLTLEPDTSKLLALALSV